MIFSVFALNTQHQRDHHEVFKFREFRTPTLKIVTNEGRNSFPSSQRARPMSFPFQEILHIAEAPMIRAMDTKPHQRQLKMIRAGV